MNIWERMRQLFTAHIHQHITINDEAVKLDPRAASEISREIDAMMNDASKRMDRIADMIRKAPRR